MMPNVQDLRLFRVLLPDESMQQDPSGTKLSPSLKFLHLNGMVGSDGHWDRFARDLLARRDELSLRINGETENICLDLVERVKEMQSGRRA